MSSIQLLDKTRKINKLLHNNNSQKVVFNDICQSSDRSNEFKRPCHQSKKEDLR
mgnify:CR=1 FL=1